jgi:hypothetical protein
MPVRQGKGIGKEALKPAFYRVAKLPTLCREAV